MESARHDEPQARRGAAAASRGKLRLRRRAWKALVLAAALAPAARLCANALRGGLGANPIEAVTHETGLWALRFLLLALAVTPLRRVFGWSALAPYRRSFGLFAFFYASLHLGTFVGLDHFFDWRAILEDVAERRFVTAGLTTFLLLLPLAVTSTRGWQRRLGSRWVRLHRLAYLAGITGVVHYLWLVKADLRPPLAYAAVLAALLGARLWWRASARRGLRQPLLQGRAKRWV